MDADLGNNEPPSKMHHIPHKHFLFIVSINKYTQTEGGWLINIDMEMHLIKTSFCLVFSRQVYIVS